MLNVSDKIIIKTDGGANPNPGRAGCAFVIEKDGRMLVAHCEYIDIATNNQAEYIALIRALEYARSYLDRKDILVMSDSQLLIKQMKGEYKIRSQSIKTLWSKARELMDGINIKFEWMSRDENGTADFLVRFVRGEKHLG